LGLYSWAQVRADDEDSAIMKKDSLLGTERIGLVRRLGF
jgi:hypothetical protein